MNRDELQLIAGSFLCALERPTDTTYTTFYLPSIPPPPALSHTVRNGIPSVFSAEGTPRGQGTIYRLTFRSNVIPVHPRSGEDKPDAKSFARDCQTAGRRHRSNVACMVSIKCHEARGNAIIRDIARHVQRTLQRVAVSNRRNAEPPSAAPSAHASNRSPSLSS